MTKVTLSDPYVALLVGEKYDTYINIINYEVMDFFALLEIYAVSKYNEKKLLEQRR